MRYHKRGTHPEIRDFGGEPLVFNIHHATEKNQNFRTTLWTGRSLQLTLMSIPVGGEIGTEMHPNVDQFIRIESGLAKFYLGNSPTTLREEALADANYAILIPRGTWHNLVNLGNVPLKLYSLYAPPKHPFGTVHKTAEEAHEAHLQ